MAKEIIMPKFGFVQEESEILEWLKNEGEIVEKNEPIAVVSTDKISMEVEAPEDGILAGIRFGVGDVVPVTEIIAYVLQPGEELPVLSEEKSTKEKDKIEKNAESVEGDVASDISIPTKQRKKEFSSQISKTATPAARRIAKQLDINLFSIKGSGPKGRIQAADVEEFHNQMPDQEVAGISMDVIEEIPLIGMRRKIAETMARSVQEAPHMTMQVDVQMEAIEHARKAANKENKDKSEKISLTAVIVKAVALAIKEKPLINSQFTPEKILVLKDINIGVATALDDGLIVPVIHHADTLDITEISKKLNDLAGRARENKILPDDLANGTFTISNLGMFGIDRFTAIINPPQSAILAVGAMQDQLVLKEDAESTVRKEKMMTLTLSADHRVLDGAQAAQFLVEIQSNLQQPEKILK